MKIVIVSFILSCIGFLISSGFWVYYAIKWNIAMNNGGSGFEWSSKTWFPLGIMAGFCLALNILNLIIVSKNKRSQANETP